LIPRRRTWATLGLSGVIWMASACGYSRYWAHFVRPLKDQTDPPRKAVRLRTG
jgi:hypothetical protein